MYKFLNEKWNIDILSSVKNSHFLTFSSLSCKALKSVFQGLDAKFILGRLEDDFYQQRRTNESID